MSNIDDQHPVEDDLQFDQAEYTEEETSTLCCSACQTEIQDVYHMVNSHPVCPPCRGQIEAGPTGGSGFVRFARALGFGVGAGAAGAALYFGVAELTGYAFGIIAIVVGFIVGVSVRVGCHGRGGWFYQLLAMGICYSAIVATHVPQVLEEFNQQQLTVETAAESADSSQVPAKTEGDTSGEAPPDTAASTPAPTPEDLPDFKDLPSVVKLIIAVLTAFLLPFWLLLSGDLIGTIIIGIALYESWKLNKRVKYAIEGPFHIAPSDYVDSDVAPEPDGV